MMTTPPIENTVHDGGPLLDTGVAGRAAQPGSERMTRVLLIEDDDETAHEIMAELVDRGFHVERVATGGSGLEKARAAEHDVLVVDRMLPEIDGLVIVETLR